MNHVVAAGDRPGGERGPCAECRGDREPDPQPVAPHAPGALGGPHGARCLLRAHASQPSTSPRGCQRRCADAVDFRTNADSRPPMARPGLEPGTPRFSGDGAWAAIVNVHGAFGRRRPASSSRDGGSCTWVWGVRRTARPKRRACRSRPWTTVSRMSRTHSSRPSTRDCWRQCREEEARWCLRRSNERGQSRFPPVVRSVRTPLHADDGAQLGPSGDARRGARGSDRVCRRSEVAGRDRRGAAHRHCPPDASLVGVAAGVGDLVVRGRGEVAGVGVVEHGAHDLVGGELG